MSISLRLEVYENDAKKIMSWLEDKNITKYLNEDENTISSIQKIIDNNQSDLFTYYLNQKGRFFLIDLDNECIGFLNLFTLVKQKEYEIVIVIGDEYNWGKQYAKHAVKLILKEAFLKWRVDKLQVKICNENQRSITLFENLKFNKIRENNEMIIYNIDFKTYVSNL